MLHLRFSGWLLSAWSKLLPAMAFLNNLVCTWLLIISTLTSRNSTETLLVLPVSFKLILLVLNFYINWIASDLVPSQMMNRSSMYLSQTTTCSNSLVRLGSPLISSSHAPRNRFVKLGAKQVPMAVPRVCL